MKKRIYGFFLFLLITIFLSGCSFRKTGVTYTQEIIIREGCFGEGESIPSSAFPKSQQCCPGLDLIPPPSDYYVLIRGICTDCGDGDCSYGETYSNCPQDCY